MQKFRENSDQSSAGTENSVTNTIDISGKASLINQYTK